MKPAVFLDRDGVIVEPSLDPRLGTWESPYRPSDVALAPGAAGAISVLKAAGFLVVGASNQPAAAKGTASLADLRAVHERTVDLLAVEGAALDDWRYCLHHPDAGPVDPPCDCRKPAPGLLLAAARHHGIDLALSWMVGDSDTDVLAGHAAGTRTVLVAHPRTAHRRAGAAEPSLLAGDLVAAARSLIADYALVSPAGNQTAREP